LKNLERMDEGALSTLNSWMLKVQDDQGARPHSLPPSLPPSLFPSLLPSLPPYFPLPFLLTLPFLCIG
jgi:hypothetical protein